MFRFGLCQDVVLRSMDLTLAFFMVSELSFPIFRRAIPGGGSIPPVIQICALLQYGGLFQLSTFREPLDAELRGVDEIRVSLQN